MAPRIVPGIVLKMLVEWIFLQTFQLPKHYVNTNDDTNTAVKKREG